MLKFKLSNPKQSTIKNEYTYKAVKMKKLGRWEGLIKWCQLLGREGKIWEGLKKVNGWEIASQVRRMCSKEGKTWERVHSEPFVAIINQRFLAIWLLRKTSNSKQRNCLSNINF